MGKLENIWASLRFGILLHRLELRLARIGLSIRPYYWIQEGVANFDMPDLPGKSEDYSFSEFGPLEMKNISSELTQYPEDELMWRLKQGMRCYGIKYCGQVAAFMFVSFQKSIRPYEIALNEREVYLFEMFTLHQFRGRNIAPYLRYRVYEEMRSMGRDILYSISDYLNSPAIRFKQKLNAKFLWLGLNITLFNKYKWHKRLKTYKN